MNRMFIRDILAKYKIDGISDVTKLKNGLTNDTYLISTSDNKKYILQKINENFYVNMNWLSENFEYINYMLAKNRLRSPKLLQTDCGKNYIYLCGDYYRVYEYIDDCEIYEYIMPGSRLTYNYGRSLGEIHRIFNTIPISDIHCMWDEFHDTYYRYNNFLYVLKKTNENKINECKKEISIIKKYNKKYSLLLRKLESKKIQKVIIHNDPKINNFLFNKHNSTLIGIIDLDTVSAGTFLYDIADALRSLYIGNNEDSHDLSIIKFNEHMFINFIEGYMIYMENILNSNEIKLLADAMFIIAMECGMRFLQDYLSGNHYFKIDYYNQNLYRARANIALAIDILKNKKTINNYMKLWRHK